MKKSLFFLGLLFVAGCNTDICDLPIEQPQADEESCITDGMTVLGEQLENPYSVANMRRAMANLAPMTRSGVDEDDITTTHYYVKFHPQSDEELDILLQDSTINFYDIPLDYEIEEYGTYYHDPSIPDSLPTYQYASIPADKWEKVKDIAVDYEILSDLFIPDEYSDDAEDVTTRSGQKMSEAFVDALVDEALALTGNEEPNEGGTRASDKWTPSGRITAYDNIVDGYIPLRHVKVRARRWFTTYIGYTLPTGYFTCNGSFKKQANYSIKWETPRWDIREGRIGQAYYNGPKKKGEWNLEISDGKSVRYATIHRAADRWYYGEIDGLKRPKHSRKEKIAYCHRESGHSREGFYTRQGGGVGVDVVIYGKNSYGWIDLSLIYSATSHELGHASHYTNVSDESYYINADNALRESWAQCLQYYLTYKEYEKLGQLSKLNRTTTKGTMIPNFTYNFQKWDKASSLGTVYKYYTPLFIDLIDDYNQRYYYKNIENNYNYPNDAICNIPIADIEKIVLKSKTFNDIKMRLINYALTTESANELYNLNEETINKLFEVYEN